MATKRHKDALKWQAELLEIREFVSRDLSLKPWLKSLALGGELIHSCGIERSPIRRRTMSETICGYEPLESEFFDAEVELRQLVAFWG
jgi:hypothetical protein